MAGDLNDDNNKAMDESWSKIEVFYRIENVFFELMSLKVVGTNNFFLNQHLLHRKRLFLPAISSHLRRLSLSPSLSFWNSLVVFCSDLCVLGTANTIIKNVMFSVLKIYLTIFSQPSLNLFWTNKEIVIFLGTNTLIVLLMGQTGKSTLLLDQYFILLVQQ